MDKGFYRLARPFGVALLAHWSLPLGALVAGGLELKPVAWLGFLVIVLVHDAGHALLARLTRQRVVAWELTGFGGACRARGSAGAAERAFVAWGGMLAQVSLALGVWGLTWLFGRPEGEQAQVFVGALTETNLWLCALNLLPIPPLDGALAWGIFRHFGATWRATERRLLISAQEWARMRREARELGVPPRSRGARPRPPTPLGSTRRGTADAAPSAFDDEALEAQPSDQAQAEIAALLERISRGKAKRD